MKKFVKNKVDTFRLEPKPQTWDKIEESLDKKKKRVAIWWFLLPLTFVLGIGSNLLYQNLNNKEHAQTDKPSTRVNTPETSFTKPSKETSKITNMEESPIKQGDKNEVKGVKNTRNIGLSQNKKEITKKSKTNVSLPSKSQVGKGKTSKNTKIIESIKPNTLQDKSSTTILQETKIEVTENDFIAITDLNKKDTLILDKTTVDLDDGLFKHNDPIKLNTEWTIGLYGGVGFTNHFSRIIENNINQIPSSSGDQRSKDKALMGNNYGASISKTLPFGLEANLSLGYTMYSWRTLYGDTFSTVTTTVDPPDIENFSNTKLYKQTGQKEYENKLNAVSIELGLGKSLLKKGHLELGAQLGLGYEHVYHADMLYYSHYSNIYAGSNERSNNYKKGFFTTSISLPITFNTNGKTSLWLGPSFKTSINSYLNTDFEKQKPYFIGVQAGLKTRL